ncbi:hypothetical protein LINPERHAP2_LOCUS32361 [Linum perenne]
MFIFFLQLGIPGPGVSALLPSLSASHCVGY